MVGYFDNAAATQVDPAVLEDMLPFLKESYGNPSSIHRLGQFAANAVQEARERLARGLHCRPSEVIFTAGGTESDNLALIGVAFANRDKGKK
ncbi:MAG TPA: aminotransferase class V-fold PLP-dependent enzyme, partial [Methanomassiliicoccales archaeon]|nr:aminotransferase class V-fold PLP-dependent enzyme [Methanomassiliicoccales archaeon]